MPNHRHVDLAIRDAEIDSFTRLLPNPPQSHTHVQHSCARYLGKPSGGPGC